MVSVKIISVLVFIIFFPALSFSADWASCEYELSRVSREAKNAERVASELIHLKDDLESLRAEYESCIQFPEIYDLMKDGCQSQLDDFNSKVDEYNSRLSELASELETMLGKVKNSLSYCGF